MWYGLAADFVVGVHICYVAYVVLGQLAVIVAAPFKWQWARNPWFRFSHLTAIAIVGYEELRGIRCPLTVWEEQLRALGGQVANGSETFMGRLFHDVLFLDNLPEVFFTTVHIAMLVMIVQALIMYPPRMFRFRRTPQAGVAPVAA